MKDFAFCCSVFGAEGKSEALFCFFKYEVCPDASVGGFAFHAAFPSFVETSPKAVAFPDVRHCGRVEVIAFCSVYSETLQSSFFVKKTEPVSIAEGFGG